MPLHEVTVTDTVHISGFELGELFAELDAEEMLMFWEGVERAVRKWRRDQSFQWQALHDEIVAAETSYGSRAREPLQSLLSYFGEATP